MFSMRILHCLLCFRLFLYILVCMRLFTTLGLSSLCKVTRSSDRKGVLYRPYQYFFCHFWGFSQFGISLSTNRWHQHCGFTSELLCCVFLNSTTYWGPVRACEPLNKPISDVHVGTGAVGDKLSSCRPLKICRKYNAQHHSGRFNARIQLHVHSVGCRLARTCQ